MTLWLSHFGNSTCSTIIEEDTTPLVETNLGNETLFYHKIADIIWAIGTPCEWLQRTFGSRRYQIMFDHPGFEEGEHLGERRRHVNLGLRKESVN
jgi:hypothetical protein